MVTLTGMVQVARGNEIETLIGTLHLLDADWQCINTQGNRRCPGASASKGIVEISSTGREVTEMCAIFAGLGMRGPFGEAENHEGHYDTSFINFIIGRGNSNDRTYQLYYRIYQSDLLKIL